MPQSDDPPSALPAASVESETPSASGPSTPAEAAPAAAEAPGQESQDREPHRPGRRRRRRHRPPRISSPEAAPASGEGQGEESPSVAEAAAADSPQATAPASDALGPPRRRRRRRRRPPPQDAMREPAPAPSEADAVAGGDLEVTNASSPPTDTASAPAEAPPVDEQATDLLPQGNVAGEHRRRRRRRRPPAGTSSSATEDGSDDALESAAGAPTSPGETGMFRQPGFRRPRRRRPPDTAGRDGDRRGPRFGMRRETDAQASDPSRRQPGRRDQRAEARSPRRGGPQDRQRGRGRDAPQKRPEPRLYALESVVDRGFEDVTDEANESQTRRVHWTIIKRTVADLNSRKPMSAVYVLQREGDEAEFPNLGAARMAVNKTIVHPEKLTMSKAEHAAAKGGGR